METHSHRPAVLKLLVVLLVVLLATGAVAYAYLPFRTAYTQILLDISPSDSTSPATLEACARSAVQKAIDGSGSKIDIGVVSGSPDAMHWTNVDAAESFWTRISIGKAKTQRRHDLSIAMRDVQAEIHATRPPHSSDELAALAAAHSRALSVSSGVTHSRWKVTLCGDGHWVGAGGDAYKADLSRRGTAEIIGTLKRQDLLPDWGGASVALGLNTVDRIDLGASREARIHQFWKAWAKASHAKLT